MEQLHIHHVTGKGESFTFLILRFCVDFFTTSMYYFYKYNKNKHFFFLKREKKLECDQEKKNLKYCKNGRYHKTLKSQILIAIELKIFPRLRNFWNMVETTPAFGYVETGETNPDEEE